MSARKFKWVVEFEVDPSWVADGFDLDEDRAKNMIERALPYSHGSETAVRIIKAPNPRFILEQQGYGPEEIDRMLVKVAA